MEKYWILYYSSCAAEVPYTYCGLPYAGKPDVQGNTASKYNVIGSDEFMKYLVTNTIRYVSLEGCSFSMDKYFISVMPLRLE